MKKERFMSISSCAQLIEGSIDIIDINYDEILLDCDPGNRVGQYSARYTLNLVLYSIWSEHEIINMRDFYDLVSIKKGLKESFIHLEEQNEEIKSYLFDDYTKIENLTFDINSLERSGSHVRIFWNVELEELR